MGQLDLEGPVLLLTVGPAASGKSTLLQRLVGAGLVDEVVSTDALRAEHGLPPDETRATYELARGRVRAALARGLTVAVDATNVRHGDRAAWLEVARTVGARPVALRVGVGLDLAELVARDAGRQRHVPHAAIAEQLELARTCTGQVLTAEGFDVLAATDVDEQTLASAVA